MNSPGADELRIRGILRSRGVGPDAPPPATPIPPRPTARPRDWLDDILDSSSAPPQPGPVPSTPPPPPAPPTVPAPPVPPVPRRKPAPRQALTDAWHTAPPRLRWLAYHATAAAAGWRLGIVDWATDTTAWYAAGHWTAPSAWVIYGLTAMACGLYRRSRAWAWPIAWTAAIPVSAATAGLLLYGTGYHP
jgi:hypothetical protein